MPMTPDEMAHARDALKALIISATAKLAGEFFTGSDASYEQKTMITSTALLGAHHDSIEISVHVLANSAGITDEEAADRLKQALWFVDDDPIVDPNA